MAESSADDRIAGGRKDIDSAVVARLPAPGSVVPGAFGFSADGRAISYLKAETASLSRVLWRLEIAGGAAPRVVARPPGSGDTDANVSREEALRRERQRLRETGITQVVRAKTTEVAVIPLGGDLFVLRGSDGPLERLTETSSPEIDPQLNAEGTRVAFVRGNELVVLDLASRREQTLSQGATEGLTHALAEFMAQEEMDRSRGFWWSPDGSRIAYQETDERHIPLFSIVHQGTDYSVETHRYPFPGASNARVRLGVVPSTGGETLWLALPVESDDFYLARVDWETPTSLLVQLLSRDQKSLRLCRIDVEKNKSTVLIEEKSETWVNLHNDLRVVEGTGEILWSSERSGFRQLELRDREGQLIRVLTERPGPVDGVDQLDSRRREVWFSGWVENPLERQLYRVSLDGGPIQKITNDPGTHRSVVSRDGETYVDTFSSRTRPPVTRLMARDGRVIATIDDAALSDPRVDQLKLTPPEIVRFQGRGGAVLYGAYYAPKSRVLGGRAPLVVMLYGGPHVQYVPEAWSLTADLTAQYLSERGFAVWKMDNRGSSRRGHGFESAINRNMGSIEVRDQADGVAFVGKNWPEVDVTRVGVTGSSYGGYMTLRCLTEAPEVFHAGVSVAPVTDWDGYDTCYTERYMGTPLDNPSGYKNASVLNGVGRLRGDLLIIHGMVDENVHFRHTARLVSALIAADKSFRMLPLPEERHSSRQEEGRRYVVEEVSKFFEGSLGKK